jgi:hypothetical protein
MVRGKRVPAGHRGSDARGRQAARGSDDRRRVPKEPEDDPLRDLRPVDEEPPVISDGDEYIWPEIQDEYEDD